MSDSPSIYVASLSDYVAGNLHGKWIDATQDLDDVWVEIRGMLAESPDGAAEEWAIHDYDNFYGLELGEYEDIKHVHELAVAIEEHGQAMAAWLSLDPGNKPDDFDTHYRGEWDSFKDYVLESDLGDMFLGISELKRLARRGECEGIVDCLDAYINWDAVVRDLQVDYSVVPAPNYQVYVFEDNA